MFNSTPNGRMLLNRMLNNVPEQTEHGFRALGSNPCLDMKTLWGKYGSGKSPFEHNTQLETPMKIIVDWKYQTHKYEYLVSSPSQKG